MGIRSKKYTISSPYSGQQAQNIDEMFEDLYAELAKSVVGQGLEVVLPTYNIGDIIIGSGGTTTVGLPISILVGSILRSDGTNPIWSTSSWPNTVAKGDVITATATNVVGVLSPGTTGLPLLSQGAGNVLAYGALSVAGGGTGLTSTSLGGVLVGATPTTYFTRGAGITGQVFRMGASYPDWSSTTYPLHSTQGDIFYATADEAIGNLAKNTTATRYLSNTGTSNAPAWAQINLTNGVTGVLPVANGGTAAGVFTAGSVVFAGASGVYTEDNANFFWDDTNNRLGIGTNVPTYPFHIKSTLNTFSYAQIENTSSGNLALCGFRCQNDSGFGVTLTSQSTGYTPGGTVLANYGTLYADTGLDGLAIVTGGVKPIIFGINLAEVARFSTSGYFGVGLSPIAPIHVSKVTSGTGGYTTIIADNNATNGMVLLLGYLGAGADAKYKALVVDNFGLSFGKVTDALNASPTYHMTLESTGKLGIGVTVPTAILHLKAGTATASTAPLKLTSGTVLTTAEAGAIEFNSDDFFATITTGAARKAFILDDGARLTSGKIPVATTNGRLIDSTAALQIAAGIPSIVASTFEKAETGTDANVLTYTAGGADEFLIVQIATDVSAITGTSIVVTITWKDSNNATATSTLTLTAVGDGTINIPINVYTGTNVVISTVFVGASTVYNISAFVTRLE